LLFSEIFGDCEVLISKQGLYKQKSYLSPAIFKYIDKSTLKNIYSLDGDSLSDFKGHYIFDVDGSPGRSSKYNSNEKRV
jgi:uncharacterized protein YhaN